MGKNLKRGLIVSCQAAEGEPLYKLNIMRYFARAVVEGGAIGIRCLIDEIDSIRLEVKVPIIALIKKCYSNSEIYITPTKNEIDLLIEKNPTVIAIDATLRSRPNGETTQSLVLHARKVAPHIELMADIATLEEAEKAFVLGFDYISTTLRGYTEQTLGMTIPDYKFIETLIEKYGDKVIVEGGIWDKEQLNCILKYQPYAVVIGTAITRPKDITQKFVSAFKQVE